MRKTKKILPHLPLDVALRLAGRSITTKKGDKGYTTKRSRKDSHAIIGEVGL
ncbi:MAG: hypothetical protein ABR903_09895 [Thermodesulfovibrionales bacterium]